MKSSKIELYAESYEDACDLFGLTKTAIIRKLPNGKYTILSQKGKHLGTYETKEKAVKRLKQIEYFKNNKKKKASKDIDESYSSTMRELRKSYSDDVIKRFQKSYKDHFDKALLDNEVDPEAVALENAVSVITQDDDNAALSKAASAIDMGDPAVAGKYLSDLLKFLLRRISPARRQHSINNLKKKIYYLNEYDMASKKTPPSSSIGQSITLLKTILLEHSPKYIREVLNNVVRHL